MQAARPRSSGSPPRRSPPRAAAGVDARDVAIVALVSAGLPDIPDELPPTNAPEASSAPADIAAELGLEESWVGAPEAAARRELRRQIGKLEAELAAYPPRAPPPPPSPCDRPNRGSPTSRSSPQRATRSLDELAAARTEAVRRGRRERRAREVRDAIVADPAAHRWEVVSAAETGEDGCVTWQVAPRMGPLGALMNWWRVKVSGGCP